MYKNSEQLFVYGTLQPGGSFYDAVSGHVRGHRRGYIRGVLADVGRYPALLEGEGWVRGAVLEVDPEALAVTDRIEGTAATPERSEYLRVRVEVFAEPEAGDKGCAGSESVGDGGGEKLGKVGEAWTYLYAHPSRLVNRPRLRVGEIGGREVYAWSAAAWTLGEGSWRERLRSMS